MNEYKEILDSLKEMNAANTPASIDEDYEIFEGQKFKRAKATYKLQVEIDKIRIQSSAIEQDVKELICKRHKWEPYTQEYNGKKIQRWGFESINDNYSEIEVIEKILQLITDMPDNFNRDNIDMGEASRMINDFLLSCSV